MNFYKRTVAPALLATFAGLSFPACSSGETDYGQVGMWVANILEQQHYSGLRFDDELSKKVLQNYLESLDSSKLYFTKSDVEGFRKKYGTRLDDMIKSEGDISAANEIFATFKERVTQRMKKINAILDKGEFDFTKKESVEINREESEWPADIATADELWRRLLKSDVLADQLRVEDEKAKAKEKGKDYKQEETTIAKIRKRYDRILKNLEHDDEEDVTNYFLSALARAYDPHTAYMSPPEQSSFQGDISNKLIGIGALLSMDEGAAQIKGIIVGGPADRQGELQLNDRIVGVGQGEEGEITDIMYMRLPRIVDQIRGQRSTIVRLKVIPADSPEGESNIISIKRDLVEMKDQQATSELVRMKDDMGKMKNLGWIELPQFYSDMGGGDVSTTDDVRRLLDRLMQEGIDGLVLDLRGNGGGSLTEAINLTGLFISRGPVVQSKNSLNRTDYRSSRNRYPVYDGPLIVLTDRTSASASEILAAALQDYRRALIVGDRATFGKGTVQTIHDIADWMPPFAKKDRAGAIKLTIQKFYRIAGGSTQLKGVIPDVILPSRRDAIEIGEESLDNPLPYDEIRARRYSLFREKPFPTAELAKRSAERIAASTDFQYIIEDTDRLRKQIARNTLSLNAEERKNEKAENKARQDKRKSERKERYARLSEQEKEKFTIYELTLSNVDDRKLYLRDDITDQARTGMRTVKEDGEEVLEFPHKFDPAKRETLDILANLIDLESGTTQTAVVPPAPKE